MKKVFQPSMVSGCWDGHKVFVRNNGDVVLADGSGATPNQTEDGPLVVDVTKPIVLFISNDQLHGMVPVKAEWTSENAKVHTTIATIQAIVEQNNALVVCATELTHILNMATELTNRKPVAEVESPIA